MSSKYYERSIDYFLRKNGDIRFFIFSDDIEWCKKLKILFDLKL